MEFISAELRRWEGPIAKIWNLIALCTAGDTELELLSINHV